MTYLSHIFLSFSSKIYSIFIILLLPFSLLAQDDENDIDVVKIIADYEAMYCSATNGEVLPIQEISLSIKGPKDKKWFASYSINNSPAIILNGNKAIEFSEYDFSLFLRNLSGKIQDYTIELKKAWLEDLTPLKIPDDSRSATIQILPLPGPEFNDYHPKAKSGSTLKYSAKIGKNSTYQVVLPDGAILHENTTNIKSTTKDIHLKIEWPKNEGAGIFKLIETDVFGCNSDTIYAGIEFVKSFKVDLGETKNICQGGYCELNPEMDLPSNYSFQWDNGETTKSILVSEPGIYKLIVTDLDDQQEVSASVEVKVQNAPQILIDDLVVLQNKKQKIDIYEDNCTYLWSDGSTKSSIVLSESGQYSVTKTSEYGCSSTKEFKAKLEDEIFKIELPEIIHMCGNEKMVLSPSLSIDQEYKYNWNTGAEESEITIETEGKYSVTVTDPDGFEKTASTIIQYHPNPIVDLGPDLVLWEGETAILNAENPGASYVWNNGATSQTIQANSGGIYMVEVSDQYGCSNKDTLHIDYKTGQKFGVFLGEDQNICEGDSVYVMVQLEGNPVAPLSFKWTGLQSDAPEVYLKKQGQFCVEVTDANGNMESDCVEVITKEVPNVDLGQDLISYPDKGIVLDAGTPNCFYTWSTGEITQQISVSTEGKYWVKVTNEHNCTSQDTIEVGFIEDYPFVGLPKAFSPNGDGHNDKLFIHGTDIKEATLVIYNRLGQKIFETNSINIGWDGSYKGELQDIDVYIYVLEVTYLDGKKMLKKGNVALLR
ncbi:T9SS type B sorting domain-containing protein [Marinifilum flexuosum]|uniref:Gliding motility-associated-like protein n=1 Tax=Marinifilum flexuosum TaxID=1117708 RepID=A0A419XAA1_9BACT|nr:gliding motility-associated C-terminal domain-containing protein [Marinifilum flexuosum]RKE04500.1 gliding motility-associated-like protein [Marinifilum flexuosum]